MSTISQRQQTIDRALDLRGAELRAQQILHVELLQTWLALPAGERRARWPQMDRLSKRRVIAAQLVAKYGDYSEASIDAALAHFDEKWGS